MAAVTHGTAHLYGVSGTIANATVLSFSINDAFALADETADETGVVIERRRDDRTKTGSITIRMKSSYEAPTIGSVITYNSVKYELEALQHEEENQGFRTSTYTIITSEGITLA